MLKNLLCWALLCLGSSLLGQNILNMELLSHVEFNESGNDIWGFVDSSGTEYAVMGTRTATRIYSLEDPANPIERYVVTGAPSTWRDIKYYRDHLYVTTDSGADGLTIIDVSMAPDSFSFTRWKPELVVGNATDTLRRTHNIYIDVPTGFAFLAGHNIGNRGVLILDLKQDPKEPVLTSFTNQFYSHDAYVSGNRLYSSELGAGLAIYDISDKTNPVEITRQETSRDFCHNAWSTSDDKYVFTTDERSSAYLDAYDVSEDGSAIFLDKFRPLESLDWPVIPHNTHILGNYAITSWYTDGVVITDISQPDNIVMVGQYDTYTNEANLDPNGSWFNGCWGAYPYLPSGIVLVSDINSGLYVFGAEYTPASFLEGTVTSKLPFENGKPISGVKVEILGGQLAYDETLTDGGYKTGTTATGTVRVAFNHPDYLPDTLDTELVAGQITVLDAQLTSSYLIGTVVDKSTGLPVEGARIVLMNEETGTSEEYTTDANGEALAVVRSDANYSALIAKWGYLHTHGGNLSIVAGENSTTFEIEAGYQDDFFANLGWQVTAMAEAGNWERDVPNPTFFGNGQSNPGEDIAGDLGNMAYVTGNAVGGGAGNDDVDGGPATLESPAIEAADWLGIAISYHYWFFNDGGNSPGNDELVISLSNGTESIELQVIYQSASEWVEGPTHEITPDMIPFTDDMRLVVSTADSNPGHLVECGLDGFKAYSFVPNASEDVLVSSAFTIQPNPVGNILNLSFDDSAQRRITITDIKGQILMQMEAAEKSMTIPVDRLTAGTYFVTSVSSGKTETQKFQKI